MAGGTRREKTSVPEPEEFGEEDMKGKYKNETGRLGEDIACRFLEEKGHTVIERNWRSGHLEIDIITIAEDGLHFVEVKTRRTREDAAPEDGVTAAKQRHVAAAAAKYLSSGKKRTAGASECMFDVIAVTIKDGKEHVSYYPQAYIPIFA